MDRQVYYSQTGKQQSIIKGLQPNLQSTVYKGQTGTIQQNTSSTKYYNRYLNCRVL